MRRMGGRGRFGKPVRHRHDDALSRVDPLEFERLLAGYYQEQGYRVDHSGTGGSAYRYDGGIDLKLYRGDEYIVVQCKRHNAYQITHNPVHELLGVMLTEGATQAIVITTGEFSDAAIRAASREDRIQLIDGDRLRGMLGPQLEKLREAEPERKRVEGRSAPSRLVREPVWEPVGDSWRNGRRVKKDNNFEDIAKLVVATVTLLILMAWQCSRSPPTATGPAPTLQPLQAPGQSAGTATREPELVDWYTGTTIEEGPHLPPSRQPTPEEIRESQRKADEAMRILAPNTPEI